MSPTPSPLNPSQTVERIREIIVGRQTERLERLEQRVIRLETGVPPAAAAPAPTARLEDRIFAHEAQLEALKENVHRLATPPASKPNFACPSSARKPSGSPPRSSRSPP